MINNKNKYCLINNQFQKGNFFSVKKNNPINKMTKFNNYSFSLKSNNINVIDEDVFFSLLYLAKNGNFEIINDVTKDQEISKYNNKILIKCSYYQILKTLNKTDASKNYINLKKSLDKLSEIILKVWIKEDNIKLYFAQQLIEVIKKDDCYYFILNPFFSDFILNTDKKNLLFINLDIRFKLKNAYAKKLFIYFAGFNNKNKSFLIDTLLKHCLAFSTSKESQLFEIDDAEFKKIKKEEKKEYLKQLKHGLNELKENNLINYEIKNKSVLITKI